MEVPDSLKAIKPYFVLAKQFRKRDPIVSYYVSMYGVQEAIKIAKGDREAKPFLIHEMDEVDQLKRTLLKDDSYNDAIESEVVGEAHVEDVALKLFSHADMEDRAGRFTKPMVKSFYTASQLFSVLNHFGELSEEVEQKMKYSKWKAVEIGKCLKNGITPTPGPPIVGTEGNYGNDGAVGYQFSVPGDATTSYKPVPKPRQNVPQDPPSSIGYPPDPPSSIGYPPDPSSIGYPPDPSSIGYPPDPPSSIGYPPAPFGYPPNPGPLAGPTSNPPAYEPPNMGMRYGTPAVATTDPSTSEGAVGGIASRPQAVTMGPEEVSRAQKLCKFASSALDYEDTSGAIEYLQKALHLLTTGTEPK